MRCGSHRGPRPPSPAGPTPGHRSTDQARLMGAVPAVASGSPERRMWPSASVGPTTGSFTFVITDGLPTLPSQGGGWGNCGRRTYRAGPQGWGAGFRGCTAPVVERLAGCRSRWRTRTSVPWRAGSQPLVGAPHSYRVSVEPTRLFVVATREILAATKRTARGSSPESPPRPSGPSVHDRSPRAARPGPPPPQRRRSIHGC